MEHQDLTDQREWSDKQLVRPHYSQLTVFVITTPIITSIIKQNEKAVYIHIKDGS